MRLLLGWVALLALAASSPASNVSAVSFMVESPLDAIDANIGDGVCATAVGECTLRAAVQETNALPGPDLITLPLDRYDLQIQGADEDAAASGDLDITDDLEIRGAGAELTSIDGRAPGALSVLDRILDVSPDTTVSVSQLTIRHGVREFGGGVLNAGSLSLTDVIVRDHGATVEGGGITNRGSLVLDGTVVRGNEAMFGGGISNYGPLTASRSSVIDNGWPGSEGVGGGIINGGAGTMLLNDVDFRDNGAHFGGAITNDGVATLTRVTLERNFGLLAAGILNSTSMTINESTLSGQGRAIFNESDGTLSVSNSTISANGIGIMNEHTADTTLLNVTVSGNTSIGIFNSNGPLPNQTIFPTVTVKNSIVAGNGETDCVDTNPDLDPVISAGHNLSSDDSCGFMGPGDMTNTDPLLGPLADNGGPTQTHALLAGSPAIDAADNAACPATDQRGVARPVDGDADGVPICDIGAYEAPAALGGTPSATPTPLAGTPTPSPTPTVTPPPSTAVLPSALPGTGGRR